MSMGWVGLCKALLPTHHSLLASHIRTTTDHQDFARILEYLQSGLASDDRIQVHFYRTFRYLDHTPNPNHQHFL